MLSKRSGPRGRRCLGSSARAGQGSGGDCGAGRCPHAVPPHAKGSEARPGAPGLGCRPSAKSHRHPSSAGRGHWRSCEAGDWGPCGVTAGGEQRLPELHEGAPGTPRTPLSAILDVPRCLQPAGRMGSAPHLCVKPRGWGAFPGPGAKCHGPAVSAHHRAWCWVCSAAERSPLPKTIIIALCVCMRFVGFAEARMSCSPSQSLSVACCAACPGAACPAWGVSEDGKPAGERRRVHRVMAGLLLSTVKTQAGERVSSLASSCWHVWRCSFGAPFP